MIGLFFQKSGKCMTIHWLRKKRFQLRHFSFSNNTPMKDSLSMNQSIEKMKEHNAYQFYRSIGSPKTFVAPMVDASELAFRMFCRKFGADICYTPMFHSRLFSEIPEYRKNFQPCPEDRPLIVQFCGNDPQTILKAAKFVENHCDAVDLNLGCPQGIARKGRYGSFILHEIDLVHEIVSTLSKGLSVPVTCKIRLLPDFDATLRLCHALVDAGCQMLVVHGRTKEENKNRVRKCNWEAIRKIKSVLPIPVIANGGIETMDDIHRCMEVTGVNGVMTSEAILESPTLFKSKIDSMTQDQIAVEYLEFARKYPPPNVKIVRAHIFKFLFQIFQVHTDLREKLGLADTFDKIKCVVDEVVERSRKNPIVHLPSKSWYRRHREPTDENNHSTNDSNNGEVDITFKDLFGTNY